MNACIENHVVVATAVVDVVVDVKSETNAVSSSVCMVTIQTKRKIKRKKLKQLNHVTFLLLLIHFLWRAFLLFIFANAFRTIISQL